MIEEEDFYNDFGDHQGTSPPKNTVQKQSHDETHLNHMNEAQLKNYNLLSQNNRVLSETDQAVPQKKLKSEHHAKQSSTKSPGGVFTSPKTIGSNHEKQAPSNRKKTPAVIIQHDIYSYDILNGNQSNNSIAMININNEGPEPEDEEEEESKQQSSKTANKNPMSPESSKKDDLSMISEAEGNLDKLAEINENLKIELSAVVAQMQAQMNKI